MSGGGRRDGGGTSGVSDGALFRAGYLRPDASRAHRLLEPLALRNYCLANICSFCPLDGIVTIQIILLDVGATVR